MRLPSLGACVLFLCPLWVPASRDVPGSAGWGGVVSSALLVPLPSCLPAFVSSAVLDVAAASPYPPVSVPLCPCGGPCSGRWPASSPGGRGAVAGCAVLLVEPCVGAKPVWFVRCHVWTAVARLGGCAPVGWSVLCPGVAVSPGGLAVPTGFGAVGGCRSLRCGVSHLCLSSHPSPSLVLWPLPCPAPSVGGPPVFFAPVLCCPQCPVPVGACSSPGPFPRPLGAGLPFALSLSRALVVGWWRGLWGADGPCPGLGGLEPSAEDFGGRRGGGGPEPRPEGGFPMPSAAWWPQGRCGRGWRGCG